MAGQLPGYPSQDTTMRDTPSASVQIDIQCLKSKWYFSKQEIENYSPSRKDGIEFEKETALRKLYCSFLQELGMELKVPQVTIATAMMLCHRFYMRQSHAKNDWQTIATVSMFLACKAEETPCWLIEVTVVAYKLMYRWDPSAPQRIKQKDVYDKQKELILIGERLLLSTIAFDFNMELPYKPLVGALKRLEISNKELAKVAWNFVNDWLRTTICLQYKPHYIAAGCLFLAAKLQQVKLPTEKERVWWMQFDVSPKQLEEVIQEMLRHLEKNRKRAVPPMLGKMVECKPGISKSKPNIPPPATTCSSNINQYLSNGATVEAGVFAKPAVSDNSPQSCIVNGSNVGHGATVNDGLVKFAPTNCSENEVSSDSHVKKQESICHQTSDCGSANSVVEDGDGEPKAVEPNSNSKSVSVQVGNNKIDVNRIREALKRKRRDITVNKKLVETVNDEIDSEAWIEMELENGIELEIAHADKRRKI